MGQGTPEHLERLSTVADAAAVLAPGEFGDIPVQVLHREVRSLGEGLLGQAGPLAQLRDASPEGAKNRVGVLGTHPATLGLAAPW